MPINNLPGQVGFYGGPWEMLGMSQTDFQSFMGAPTTNPPSLNGIVYMDNDGIMGNQSSGGSFQGTSGEGMLYVDGDLTLNAGFTYTGMVYVEGDLKLNGQAWILGALVVRGKTTIKVNGGATVLYSSDAITQKLGQYGGQYTTLLAGEVDRNTSPPRSNPDVIRRPDRPPAPTQPAACASAAAPGGNDAHEAGAPRTPR